MPESTPSVAETTPTTTPNADKPNTSSRRSFLKKGAELGAGAGLAMMGVSSAGATETPTPTKTPLPKPEEFQAKTDALHATQTTVAAQIDAANEFKAAKATSTAQAGQLAEALDPNVAPPTETPTPTTTATATATKTATVTPTTTPTLTNEQISIKEKAGLLPTRTATITPTIIPTSIGGGASGSNQSSDNAAEVTIPGVGAKVSGNMAEAATALGVTVAASAVDKFVFKSKARTGLWNTVKAIGNKIRHPRGGGTPAAHGGGTHPGP